MCVRRRHSGKTYRIRPLPDRQRDEVISPVRSSRPKTNAAHAQLPNSLPAAGGTPGRVRSAWNSGDDLLALLTQSAVSYLRGVVGSGEDLV